MDEVLCRWCRKLIRLNTDENGWPTLPAAAALTSDHAACLREGLDR